MSDLPETADLLYGVPAIAKYLNIKPAAVYHLVALGKLPARKLGNKTIVSTRAKLSAYINQLMDEDGSQKAA
jgi:hypothetical protein